MRPEDLGPRADTVIPSWLEEATSSGDKIRGVVVAVDHFGNLITNICSSHLDGFGDAVVEAGGRTIEVRRTYADVTPGDYLALINSFDALELARAERSAAEGLGLGRGAPVTVRKA